MERPYGLEGAVEVEGCSKGWEVDPRAFTILETIKAVPTTSLQCNCPPKLERGHPGRLSHLSVNWHFSTQFTLETSNPPAWQLLLPTISSLEGKLNSHVSDSFTPNSSQWYIERAVGESEKFHSLFHFLVLPPQSPLSSLCGPGLFLRPAVNHLHSKCCSWILYSQLSICLWACNLANTGSFIPINWKSKHIFYRNPIPIDPHSCYPCPAAAIRLMWNKTDVLRKALVLPHPTQLPGTHCQLSYFYDAGQQMPELRTLPLWVLLEVHWMSSAGSNDICQEVKKSSPPKLLE